MEVKYILIATGSMSLPRIDHVICINDIERVKEEATKVAIALHGAGYFNFNLYEIDPSGPTFHHASISVEDQAPIAIIR